MNLSKNFSLSELTKSETAIRKSIDNTPSNEALNNLTTLCNMVLQKVRNSHGAVTITSGYRAPELVYGEAFSCPIDMWSLGVTLAELYSGRAFVHAASRGGVAVEYSLLLGRPPPGLR
jgi:serine/threonine protein kinase